MKVILTGATGFLGSHLVRYLAGKGEYFLYPLIRTGEDASIVKLLAEEILPIADEPTMNSLREHFIRIRPDALIHLASLVQTADEPERIPSLIQANVTFGTQVLQAAVEAGVTACVNTGSFWEAMDRPGTYRPVNLYAATKRAFEDILYYYADAHGLRVVTLKLFGTYGPGDPRYNVFQWFEKSIGAAEPIAFSPGEQILDVLHVDDVVRAYEKALAYAQLLPPGTAESFEIGSGEALTLRQVAGIYEQARGKKLNIAWGQRDYRPREVMQRVADLAPAKAKLHWKPEWTVREGIARLVEENLMEPRL